MIIKALRDGSWVTAARIRVYSLISLFVFAATLFYLVLTAHGLNDYLNRPLGTDFSNVYAAGTYAQQGTPEKAFAADSQANRERQIFGNDTPFFGWHYPPLFLLIAKPLSLFSYKTALVLWLGVTLAFYLVSIRKILPLRRVILPALGFTAVWVNTTHGNNGFLTAALIGFALHYLPTRPLLAGIFFGCLTYKPQYGLLVPFALLAGGYYRAIFSAALTVFILIGISFVTFGLAPWAAFFANAGFTQSIVLEQGGTGFYKMQSLFAWVRDLGGSVTLAYTLQSLLALLVTCSIWKLWRSVAAHELKAAALIFAMLIVTPYSLDYDLMILAPAGAFLVQHGLKAGFVAYEKTLLAFAAIMPILARPVAQHTDIFLGVLVPIFLLFLVQRARLEYGKLPV